MGIKTIDTANQVLGTSNLLCGIQHVFKATDTVECDAMDNDVRYVFGPIPTLPHKLGGKQSCNAANECVQPEWQHVANMWQCGQCHAGGIGN